jgi:hypothetical protein
VRDNPDCFAKFDMVIIFFSIHPTSAALSRNQHWNKF